MTIYDELQPVAKELFAEFGQGVIQYIKMTPGAGPVDNPGPATPTPHTVNATARGVQFKYIDGSLIVATDLQVSMPVDDRFEPDMKGFVSIDGVKYKIVQIVPKPAAGTKIVNLLIVRK